MEQIQHVIGKSPYLQRLMFEEAFRVVAPYRKFDKDENNNYYDGGTEEAWQLWQMARCSPEYVNRPTFNLVQDLLKYIESRDVYVFEKALRLRAMNWIEANKELIRKVTVGPWEDKKI